MRRLRRTYAPHGFKLMDVPYTDRNSAAARMFSKNLDLDNCINYVYIISEGINMLQDFLVINMASNDLANIPFTSESYAKKFGG